MEETAVMFSDRSRGMLVVYILSDLLNLRTIAIALAVMSYESQPWAAQ